MSKWTSRKWILGVWGEIVGAATALGGFVYGDKEVAYGGLAICMTALIAYLKSEKDVDAAREGAATIYECDCNCPSCNPEE
jgi:hypothetical protein